MAPKKSKKISLNEFLGDSALGSWADEMESLPSAPATKNDEEIRSNDRFGRKDDFSRSERNNAPRDDVPIPSQPPFTVFIGNLAFDLTELDLEQFFNSQKPKSIKIIKDRDEKPKGFGYVEFENVDGLKDALTRSGSNLAGRSIRVSVAEPPKERTGSSNVYEDNSKFDSPWRRDGPLPELAQHRDGSRRRFESNNDRPLPSVSEGADDWRSNRLPRSSESELSSFKRKGPGFSNPEGQPSAADKEESWTMGSKFKPSASADEVVSKVGALRAKNESVTTKDPMSEETDWRTSARPRQVAHAGTSPGSSTPPTPQMGRRKLELLPRSGNVSASPSPLSSPKMGPVATVLPASRANPFGAAKPVDVTSREKEIAAKLEKDREFSKDRLPLSRTNSKTASERTSFNRNDTPALGSTVTAPVTASTKLTNPILLPNVRPTLSFARVAANKEGVVDRKEDGKPSEVDSVAVRDDAS